MSEATQLFDAYYYAHGCGHPYRREAGWLALFGRIADQIVSGIAPTTVLDAGCALGFLVETLREREVQAFGIDISPFAIDQVFEPIRPFCWLGSVADPFPQRYDLIVSIEVLEHMPAATAEQAIANFCAHSDDILFSSTPFDYKEATHLNVRPPEYWAAQFARYGFVRDVDFDAGFITPWAVRFRKRHAPLHRIVQDYERRFWLYAKENSDLRSLAIEQRNQLAQQSDEYERLRSEYEHLAQQLAAVQPRLAEDDLTFAQHAALQQRVATLEAAIHEQDRYRIHVERAYHDAITHAQQQSRALNSLPSLLRLVVRRLFNVTRRSA